MITNACKHNGIHCSQWRRSRCWRQQAAATVSCPALRSPPPGPWSGSSYRRRTAAPEPLPLASALSSPLAAAASISGLVLADFIVSGGSGGGGGDGWRRWYMVGGREGFETETQQIGIFSDCIRIGGWHYKHLGPKDFGSGHEKPVKKISARAWKLNLYVFFKNKCHFDQSWIILRNIISKYACAL